MGVTRTHLTLTLKVKGSSLRFASLSRCFAAASPAGGRGEKALP